MTKAFTHLCKKINLSLYGNTLTIYPKTTQSQPSSQIKEDINSLLLSMCVEMGACRFVYNGESDHYLYHQDSFDLNDLHWHAQFQEHIGEEKLEKILCILERYSFISPEEHISFIDAYYEANPLPDDGSDVKRGIDLTWGVEETDAQAAIDGLNNEFFLTSAGENATPVVENKIKTTVLDNKEKCEQPTLSRFKKGFFNTSLQPQQTNVEQEISATSLISSII